MGKIWSAAILISCAVSAATGRVGETARALLQCGEDALALMMTLLGSMTLWSGLMEMIAVSGDLDRLGRLIRRLLRGLFPGLEDPGCWRAISMNISANLLGLGNAATPAGLEASRLLVRQGDAGIRALGMLLALNNAGLQLMPTTVIALRASAGSSDPAGIWLPSLAVSAVSTVTAALLMTWCGRRKRKNGSAFRHGSDVRAGRDCAQGRIEGRAGV